MKYFLAVSSIPQAIDQETERILYIEDGCLKNKKITDNDLILDKPLKSSQEVLDAFKVTDSVLEEVLGILKDVFNNFHHINYNKATWRVILFVWLEYYTEAMYHKLINVNDALRYGQMYSYVLDKESYMHPFFWRGFWMWGFKNETYNFQLYSNVLNFKKVEVKKECFIQEATKRLAAKPQKTIREIIFSTSRKVINWLSHKSETVIINPQNFGFGLRELIVLAIRSKFRIGFFYPDEINVQIFDYNEKLRNEIKIEADDICDSEFKRLLSMYVMKDIPTMFFEGLKCGIDSVKCFQCKKIISAEDYEDYKASMLMALTKHRNGKIYLIQIGGDADLLLGKTEAYLDAKMADVLYSGGWRNDKYPCEIRTLTNPRYWKAKKAKIECEKKYDIMYVGTATSAYRLVLGLASNLWPREYINDNVELIARLVEDRNYRVKVRFLSFGGGWDMEKSLAERLDKIDKPDKTVEVDSCRERFIDSVQECKICIVSSIETVWAETLSMDIPLIIFIPKYLEYFSGPGWKLVNKFKNAGIYFNTYTEVIQCLDHIDNIDRWWKEKQPIMREIKNQYCWCADDPQKEWIEEFIKISKE